MEKFITGLQYIISLLGAFLGWFLGGVDGFMTALIWFVVVDYLTGVMVAIIEKKLSSKVGFRGIFKKVIIFCLVGISNILDIYVIKTGSAIRLAVISFYIYNEGVSILENISVIGLPVPEKLKDALIQVGNHDKKEDE
ncbi:phage holin family protein [Lachnoclostridium phytofermentans]|uniref:Toxin secretion/phage lysis holin n=1 Tax=Lachnoclostridium phytofermentans (strain ATCC 700394 / DSM 18823 / ISDg) TaxID=357809 RepID=A9KPM8_LACP7|nr:phage holin family protein [Lachnoclostridium phytofermentans]ABX43302.1 toxin secretion/phage lysis holin [Lachnoclostridium phytofermentans ISDg]